MSLADDLGHYGFQRIAIADDTPENLAAARSLVGQLPTCNFEFYERGDLLVAQIPQRDDLGLILTDLSMETADAGLDVLQTAWSYHVPAFVCSGGYEHRNQPQVRVAPLGDILAVPDGMTKDNPALWYGLLESIAGKMDQLHLVTALLRAKRAGVDVPDTFSGEQARRCAEPYLRVGEPF